MRRLFVALCVLLVGSVLFSSCALIIGGSRYKATVTVLNDPGAQISYKGAVRGVGIAAMELPRKNVDNLSFVVSKEGCEDQTFSYQSRKVRWGALIASVIFWSGYPVPIPYGAIVDFASGAVYKPDDREPGVVKNNYNSFTYLLQYTGCEYEEVTPAPDNSVREKLTALKSLFLEGLITAEEYERQKQKILDGEDN